jgi:ATP/maltotriose-dependent transcriptional regulator MalT
VLARCAFFTGDLPEALKQFDASRASAEETGSKYGQSLGYLGMAVVLELQGELVQAKPMYEKILVGARIFAPKHNAAFILHYLADLNYAMGDLKDAREHYEMGVAERDEIGEKLQAQRDRLSLALLDIEEGRAEEAEKLARETLPKFHAWNLPNDEAQAEAVLARALVAEGKQDDAEAELARAVTQAAGTESELVRLDVALAQGIVLGASKDKGKQESAQAALTAGIDDAGKRGFVGYWLEMRLRAAQLELARGQRAAAVEHAQAIVKDAKAKSFGLIAKKAAALK